MSECNPQIMADALDSTKGKQLAEAWTAHNSCMTEIYGKNLSTADTTKQINDYMNKVSATEKKGVGADLVIIDPNATNVELTYKINTAKQTSAKKG